MSMFRSKKLDLGCFLNVKVIRDHTKRKVFAGHETERFAHPQPVLGCTCIGRWDEAVDIVKQLY
jgi:hypothetical protein